jgi:tetratricopeptide (TPR) repeat protein
MTAGKHCLFSLILFFSVTVSVAQKSPASESDLKRQAEKLFEKESYAEAAPMYSQLLSLYSRDAVYNYRYGICLLMSGIDKTGAASYLEAAAKSKEMDPDVNFYLGRSYMFMDHYNEAIAAFTTFKKLGSSAKQNKLQPDIYIRNCENANQLRMDRKNVVVISKSKVSRPAFFASYDFTDAAGKMLTTPERFLAQNDKEKMTNPVMFMTKDGETIYYASYGKKGDTGKDIFRVVKLPDGTWSEPAALNGSVNTDMDEDYPYLDKDGRTLYFSSKGHNSMGGFDIFKSQYDFNSGRWSDPVNIGIPINTVDDDIFYMPSTKGETAVYSTAIECETGKIELRNIRLGDAVNNLAVISGKYISQDQVTRRDARITVIRTRDNGVVTSVKTDRSGTYELVLPAGDEYMLIVEGGSYLPHAENFTIPGGEAIPGMQQKILMNKAGDTEEMTMSNFFTPSPADPAVASVEKPSQVSTSEFDLKDTASRKMQAITVDGKTLYVTPPSEKNLVPSGLVTATPDVPKDETITSSASAKTEEQRPVVEKETAAVNGEGNPDKGNQKETTTPVKHTSEKSGDVASEKTSNAEIVKIAFDDALAVKEEAKTLRENAFEKRIESKSLDSLSKEQVRQANELIASGDKDQSQQVFKESRENAVESQEKMKEAESIESEASQKELDVQTSLKQAVELMKEFKVDTTSVAYKSISAKDETEPAPGDVSTEQSEEKQVTVPVTSEEETMAEDSHSAKAKKLFAEADSLTSESQGMADRSESATAKADKTSFDKKSKDLKKDAELKRTAGQTEAALAVKDHEQPVALNSGNVNQNEKINGDANGNLSVSENKSAPDSNGGKTELNHGVDQQETDMRVNENAVAGSGEQKKQEKGREGNAPVNDKISGHEVTAKSEDEKNLSANESAESNTVKDATVNKNETPVLQGNSNPVTSAHENRQDAVSEPVLAIADEAPVEVIEMPVRSYDAVNADPAAKTHYRNYEQNLYESKKLEAESKATEAKLLKRNTKESRDSLEKQTTALNIQSIRQWQESQKELSLAKEIDPEIEEKVMNASPESTSSATTGKEKSEEPVSEKPLSPAVNKTIEPAGSPLQEPIAEILDTTRPEYPDYVKTQKEIQQKQSETVNIFVEGMQLNKKASAIKADEMTVRDKAEVTSDKTEKATLIVKADSLGREADSLTGKSKEMLAAAQKNTGTVKELTAKSDKIKEGLVVKENVQASEKETAHNPQQNEQSENKNSEAHASTDLTLADTIAKKEVMLVSVEPGSASPATAQSSSQKVPETKTPVQSDIPDSSEPARSSASPAAANSSSQKEPETKTQSDIPDSSSVLNKIAASEPAHSSASPAVTNKTEEEKPLAETRPVQQDEENHLDDTAPVSEPSASKPVEIKAEKKADQSQGNSPVQAAESKNSQAAKESQASTATVPDMNFENKISDAGTFSMAKGETYSSASPIPMDPALPEGLVFKVQIGAFRKPLPDNTFKNLQPLSGETTRPGWIRYCLGLFRTFEPANLLKKEVRSMGYPDAFVVAYFNGKRIPLYDAYTMISKANAPAKKTYAAVSEDEFRHLAKFEIKNSNFSSTPDEDTKAFYGTTEKNSAELVEYAVQVGVYKSSHTPSALASLLPLNTEQTTSGLYRFTTGRFDHRAAADSMKRVAVVAGIKDAFVVIYRGGKKAGPAETMKIIAGTKAVSGQTPQQAGERTVPVNQQQVASGDIVFKIQLGAFKENVPFNTVSSFLAIADKGISQETDARGLHIFYAGTFRNYDEALEARKEIASKGVKDAFIVAFVKGQRTSATDALKLLNGK